MNTPKKVTRRQSAGGPVLEYQWRDWGMLLLVPFGLAFTGLPVWFALSGEGPIPAGIWPVLLLFSAIGLGLTYWSLGRVINHSELSVRNGRLLVRHRPLPWRYAADLDVMDIQAVQRQTYFNQSESESGGGGISIGVSMNVRNERLVALLANGKQRILIPKLELAAADFLAQSIEAQLGLRQAQSTAAQAVSMQASQQAQKRVEAGQTRQLLPFLFVMGLLCVIGGIVLLVISVNERREALASQSWPTLQAQVVDYWMTEVESDEPVSNTTYTPSLELAYTVAGETFTIFYDLQGGWDTEEEAALLFDPYPPGSEMTVYYNPQNPERARFDTVAPDLTLIYWLTGVIIALGLFILALLPLLARQICQAEGCPEAWKHWPFWRDQIPLVNRFSHAHG